MGPRDGVRDVHGGSPGGSGGMRAAVQVLGGALLGLGLAAGIGLDPGMLFAAYTAGLGALLLCLGLLLPETPGGEDGSTARGGTSR